MGMFSNNLVSILTGIHVAVAGCMPNEEQSTTAEVESLFFPDMITLEKDEEQEPSGVAAYDTFVTAVIKIKDDELRRAGTNTDPIVMNLTQLKEQTYDHEDAESIRVHVETILN